MRTGILIFFLYLIPALVYAKGITFITNVKNPVSQISKEQLQDFFFKRVRIWPGGQAVRFFDRMDNSEVRSSFLSDYLDRSSRQVDQYWIAQKFNIGDSAPSQVTSDSMVINLVSRFSGGIGYVAEGTRLNKDVKVLKVMD